MRKADDRAEAIEALVAEALGGELHEKQVGSLADAALGTMAAASLAIPAIGHALAMARGLNDKHAIKQMDRLVGNEKIDVQSLFPAWIAHAVGERRAFEIAMDWTDFDADDQATLCFNLITSHGRAAPLMWFSVFKAELKDGRNAIEDMCLKRLKAALPSGVEATILADRGFGDAHLMEFLTELGLRWVVRFRCDVHVTNAKGETRPAARWLNPSGPARVLRDAELTRERIKVGAVVCVRDKGMKEAWHLAASDRDASSTTIKRSYARRWTIEPSFRDNKDLRFGMGLSSMRVSEPYRRDRLLLISAIAVAALTALGEAGESLGYDRWLKSNTSKKRTHSLFRQGCLLFDHIPTMTETRLLPLLRAFEIKLKISQSSFKHLRQNQNYEGMSERQSLIEPT
jgi:hypothetical protein